MKSAIALWLLVAAGVAHAAPLIDAPVAELRLKSGKVLTQAVAKSYTPTTVFVKHAGGGASVKYEDFPDEFATALTAKRPAPPTPEELAAIEARRQAALAREAAGRRSETPIPSGPSMPLNLSNLGMIAGAIRGHVVDVEIHNFSPEPYSLGPQSIVATLQDGSTAIGGAWVGLNADSRIVTTLKRGQVIVRGSPASLSVHFQLAENAVITRVDWLHPKN